MARIAAAIAVLVAAGWFLFARGGEAAAVTDCLSDAGATVEESPNYGRVFPHAIAVRSLDRVESYPELDGAQFYSLRYGADRAILFIGKDDEAATAFESTLTELVGREGQTLPSRRSGRALLVWERPTLAPALDDCLG